jgi:hypothetical protein
VTYSIRGGIYGNPYVLMLSKGDDSIEILEGEGRKLHTQFMNFPKGPMRDLVVKTVYEELHGQAKEG